jgi:hypothetical protein
MAKRHTRHKRQRRNRHRTMKGGTFTQQELQQLQDNEFTQSQISTLQDLGVSINEVIQKVNTIRNQEGFSGSTNDISEQAFIELLNEHIFENSNTQHLDANDDQHNLDGSFESQGTMDIDELNTSQGTMNLDELNSSRMSGYTTSESDDEFGGRRRRRTTKKRRGKKAKKTRKQRGGMCFGNGVGANSYDPNYSIYNTNMLKLFPYRPN